LLSGKPKAGIFRVCRRDVEMPMRVLKKISVWFFKLKSYISGKPLPGDELRTADFSIF
jgi:hypothetical protein